MKKGRIGITEIVMIIGTIVLITVASYMFVQVNKQEEKCIANPFKVGIDRIESSTFTQGSCTCAFYNIDPRNPREIVVNIDTDGNMSATKRNPGQETFFDLNVSPSSLIK